MVTWGIWYIDEAFLFWIIPSIYQSHEFKVWACITSFVHISIWYITCCVTVYSCVLVITTQFSIHAFLFGFIDTHGESMHATWHSVHHSLGSSDSPRPACLDLGGWTMVDFMVITIAQRWHHGSALDRPEPYPSRPPARLPSFPFVTCEHLSVLFIFVYLLYSHISPIGDVIFL